MNKVVYSKDHKEIVRRLKIARKQAGLSQQEASKILGKTQSFISKLETNQRRIDVVLLKELATLYKKSVRFLMGE